MTTPPIPQPLSVEQIEDRLARDGFPAMCWLWQHFRRSGQDPERIDAAALAAARTRHLNALVSQPGWLVTGGILATAGIFMVVRQLGLGVHFFRQVVVFQWGPVAGCAGYG